MPSALSTVLVYNNPNYYRKLDRSTELARAVDVVMERAKRIDILISDRSKQLVSLFSVFSCFLKEIKNMFSVFVSSFSINLQAFYHECCFLIGFAAHNLSFASLLTIYLGTIRPIVPRHKHSIVFIVHH